ncbi:MAG: inositol monophosphatase family protein [Pseudomonadota bacterium]
MQPVLNIGIRAARKAGDLIFRYLNRLDSLKIASKQHNEFVTEVDQKAEQEIINTIQSSYPDHAFLGEESGASGEGDQVWIIDPLDGTTNFIHGFPQFAVSLAFKIKDRLELAIVYDPLRQELFTACRGEGAQLDGKKIRVSNRSKLAGTLIGTGFPYRANAEHVDEYFGMLKSVLKETAGVRRPGAAALDLAYVAAGRLDGFWEIGLQPWDMAGGALLIQEAGGIITGFLGKQDYMETGNVLAGTPKVHGHLMKLIKPHLGPGLK